VTRPLPSLAEPDTAAFWRACGQHRLTAPFTSGESAGLGVIYTFTVVRQHGHPFFRAHTPYIVAMIDMDEGFRIMAEVDTDPSTVHIGQRVQVGWEDHEVNGEPIAVPVFTPAG
jgi:uncharacterized protein